jgi:hypothetical protein
VADVEVRIRQRVDALHPGLDGDGTGVEAHVHPQQRAAEVLGVVVDERPERRIPAAILRRDALVPEIRAEARRLDERRGEHHVDAHCEERVQSRVLDCLLELACIDRRRPQLLDVGDLEIALAVERQALDQAAQPLGVSAAQEYVIDRVVQDLVDHARPAEARGTRAGARRDLAPAPRWRGPPQRVSPDDQAQVAVLLQPVAHVLVEQVVRPDEADAQYGYARSRSKASSGSNVRSQVRRRACS